MEMTHISIDLEVYKEIQKRLESFNETPNQILRRVFELPAIVEESPREITSGLHLKGVHLIEGLKLRKKYKGRMLEAEVKDGHILYDGKSFTSPSGAAVEATGHSVNGWRFWEFFDESAGTWRPLSILRRGRTVSDGNW